MHRRSRILLLLILLPVVAMAQSSGRQERSEIGGAVVRHHLPESEHTTNRPSPSRLFDASIGIGLGAGLPTGSFYSGTDAGISVSVDARVALSGRVYLRALARSQQNLISEKVRLGGYQVGDVALDVDQYLLLLGFTNAPDPASSLRLYGEFGGGYADHVFRFQSEGRRWSEHLGRFVFGLQVGCLTRFGDGPFGLDAGISVVAKVVNPEPNESMGFILGAQAGVVWLIGGDQR